MTALCGGGASEAKPGFSQTAVITGAVLDSALVVVGLETLAAALAPFIAGTVYDLTQFCNTDPPADPGLTAQDIIDVNNFVDPTVSIPALLKVKQWFESWYWYDACQCSSVGTPAAPSPSNPGNVVGYNPGLPTQSGPCWNVTRSFATNPSPNLSTTEYSDITTVLLPTYGATLLSTNPRWPGGASVVLQSIPAGASNLIWTGSVTPPISNSSTFVELNLMWFDASDTFIGGIGLQFITGAGQPLTATFSAPVPTSAAYWGIQIESRDTISHTFTSTLQFSCANGTSLGGSPCCPPDPSLDTRLAQIYGLLQSIYQSLPSPLNSYASGTVHSGLSGNGTVTLSAEVLAVRVDITTDSAHLGESAGDPVYLFDRGFIVPVINSAPVRQPSRLVYNPQLFPLPQLTEQIGYSLGPGIVASITELTAGP